MKHLTYDERLPIQKALTRCTFEMKAASLKSMATSSGTVRETAKAEHCKA